MKGFISAMIAVVALVVLAPSVQACHSGDGSVVGGGVFSVMQQPVVASYVQQEVACVPQQAVFAQQVYSQPIVQRVVSNYGYSQPIVVRRSIFRDRVVVHHGHGLNVRVGY